MLEFDYFLTCKPIYNTDRSIWDCTKKEGYTTVTFDLDFYDLSLSEGHPSKIIWIKSGNTATENLA